MYCKTKNAYERRKKLMHKTRKQKKRKEKKKENEQTGKQDYYELY